MKFACAKCNHVLTNDLYLTHKIQRTPVIADNGEIILDDTERPFMETTVKPGSYIRHRYETAASWFNRRKRKRERMLAKAQGKRFIGWHNIKYVWTERKICINKEDAVGCFLYPFVTGNGCCANHYVEVECANCYTQVGWEFSDCYESLFHIQFIDGKVVNDFSRRPTVSSPRALHVTQAPGVNLTEDAIKRNVDSALKAFKQGKSEPFVDPIDMDN